MKLGFGTLPTGVSPASPSPSPSTATATATATLMNVEVPNGNTSPAQCGDNRANKIMLLEGVGEIVTSEESDFWEV